MSARMSRWHEYFCSPCGLGVLSIHIKAVFPEDFISTINSSMLPSFSICHWYHCLMQSKPNAPSLYGFWIKYGRPYTGWWIYLIFCLSSSRFNIGPLKFAGSDAANFSRKGIHATTLFGLAKKGTPPDWHTKNDIPERLSGERIAEATEIALHFVELVDSD